MQFLVGEKLDFKIRGTVYPHQQGGGGGGAEGLAKGPPENNITLKIK